ncbi:hypothetical protein H0H92_014194 [Tricholoma furcatifolium]|nr:hypothetical protein H0H92_014194 [Tricholoma furcatifolium]
MPVQINLTPMEPLLGHRANSLSELTIVPLGSSSVTMQIRTSGPFPCVDESVGPSGLTTYATGVLLNLTRVPGQPATRLSQPRANDVGIRSPASASTSASRDTPFVVLSTTPRDPLPRQTESLIPQIPCPRLSLRKANHPSHKPAEGHEEINTQWSWLSALLITASISIYCVMVYRNK